MSLLEAESVTKSYADTVALDDVSLEIDAGEVFALVGPNGAGKTTFVGTLTGTVRPDSGSIHVFGTDPGDLDSERVGLLPQAFAPPDRLTPLELVTYYAGLYDSARDPVSVLQEVGLDPEETTWYENLSGGQQRRAAVATTLVNDPDLLFLDEPTTGIDPGGRIDLWEVLEGLAAGGTAIFLTTHDMDEAERLADRVGLLSDGVLVQTGDPQQLIDEYAPESRLRVETDADTSVLAETRFEVEPREDGLVVHGVEPAEIATVVDSLDTNGNSFDAISWTEPGLQDAYLELAGRSPTAENDQEVQA